ncbi:molecular chaperone HtpG [Labilibaculum sp. DW002]|uniref:Molecular chaperone HtpG n=1 Tax=Paralabilibaculum antarcticum TaxID=2912572 RepID=A0ABT5VPI5_9BACT|nr:molecular chaperone HtpG [Labilibaculum sp. DW002]MDE5417351.1 molecular chaperone HtpG [Labilibaculum sp. DW002]
MSTGKIGVTSQDLFPIIKKFLYSDHDIFLREIVSNAVDATQKLKTLSSTGEFKGDLGDLKVSVAIDKEAKTITISDNGIGMTQEEIEKYINQIAFSGAEEFMDKYKDQANAIIGHFGLGFYSSFMVSDKVDIISLSHKEGAQAVKWSCEGNPEYTLEEVEKADRGTDIVMHISEDEKEFLEEGRIQDLLNKYCKFLPIEITFGKKKEWKDGKEVVTEEANLINDTTPAWTKKPSDLTEENYKDFYRQLYPMGEEPLFHIHLNVDYPFNLTGILYFPKIKNSVEIQKNKIQLYCNQVFVTDSVEGIVPEFLTLLHGVIDSPDIPLNVSRSYLQSDGNVKKISNHITKKVADSLFDIFKKDREDFENKWDDLRIFVQYGMLSEEKFYDRAKKFMLLKNTDGKYFTTEEYETIVKENQTDKEGNMICLYATNAEEQYTYIDLAKAKGYDVLLMDSQLDNHLINTLEQKTTTTKYVRVDSDVVDKLIQKDEVKASNLTEEQKNDLIPVFNSQLPSEKVNYIVAFESLGAESQPVMITQAEFMRRMKDMAAMNPGMAMYGEMPDSYNLVVNTDHALIENILSDKDDKMGANLTDVNAKLTPLFEERAQLDALKKDKKEDEVPQEEKDKMTEVQKQITEINAEREALLTGFGKDNQIVKQLIDLALLANNMLKGEELAKFVKRSVDMIK